MYLLCSFLASRISSLQPFPGVTFDRRQTFFSCLVPFFFLRSCRTITASLACRFRQMVKGVTIKFFDLGRRRAALLSVIRRAASLQTTLT